MKEAAQGPAVVQATIKLVSEQSLPLEAAVLATVTALPLDLKPSLALLGEVLSRGLARPSSQLSGGTTKI